MNKRIPIFRILLILLFVVVLVLSGLWLFYPVQTTQGTGSSGLSVDEVQALAQKLNFPQISKDHEIGATESILNDDKDNAVSIHYPVIGSEEIDAVIKQTVDRIQSDFEAEKAELSPNDPKLQSELTADYSSYVVGKQTASVVFEYSISFSSLAHPDEQVETLVFDLKEGKQLSLNDVLQGDWQPVLAAAAKRQFEQSELFGDATRDELFQTAINDPSLYQKFALRDGELLLYFDRYALFAGSYGIPSAAIPFSELGDCLKLDVEGKLAPTIAAPETPSAQEPSNQQSDSEQPSKPADAPAAIDPNKPMVALSFDDGPHPSVTPRILDILKQNGAHATFFVLGNRVDSYPDVLKREYEEGNEIGSHTFSHPSLTKLDTADLNYQVSETDSRIKNILGVSPTLLRPPYGAVNDTVRAMVNKPLALWNLDTQDWKSRSRDAVVNVTLRDVSDGDIILMHDLYGSTADACETIVPELVKRGYQVVTVSQLLEARSVTLTAGKTYTDAMRRG